MANSDPLIDGQPTKKAKIGEGASDLLSYHLSLIDASCTMPNVIAPAPNYSNSDTQTSIGAPGPLNQQVVLSMSAGPSHQPMIGGPVHPDINLGVLGPTPQTIMSNQIPNGFNTMVRTLG